MSLCVAATGVIVLLKSLAAQAIDASITKLAVEGCVDQHACRRHRTPPHASRSEN